jgi:hypothetical protein
MTSSATSSSLTAIPKGRDRHQAPSPTSLDSKWLFSGTPASVPECRLPSRDLVGRDWAIMRKVLARNPARPVPTQRVPRYPGTPAPRRVLCFSRGMGCLFGAIPRPAQAVTKLAESGHSWRVETAGAKARPYFSMPCGPTKVVPFYKARFQLRFVTDCCALGYLLLPATRAATFYLQSLFHFR